MERVPIKSEPKLFDNVIAEIQQGLANNLMWLNFSFGKAERLVKQINGRKYYTPNVYLGKNEYVLIAPDSGLGNFSFFVLDEPQDVEWAIGDRTHLSTPFSLIVWFDIRTIEQNDERNTESVKQKILQLLNGGLFLRNGRITINRIYEKAENIFKGFSLDEIDNQFLMQPFAGFRFEGEMSVATDCIEVIPPTPPVEPPTFEIWVNDKIDTFSFVINENETITIPINNYYGRWVVDREITSLKNAFANNTLWKQIIIKDLNLNYSISFFAANCGASYRHYIDISECELNTTDYSYFMANTLTKVYAPKIKSNLSGFMSGVSDLIATDDVLSNLSIGNCSGMSKDGVLSLINFAARNNTYTLHSSVYGKCASGGEWHTEIQSAIDAKAAQGFTVTLISA